MKRLIGLMTIPCLVSLLVYSGAFTQEHASDSKPVMDPESIYLFKGPTIPYRVTIQSANGVVSELAIPKGTLLSLQLKKDQNTRPIGEHTSPAKYQGDIILRMRRADEINEGGSALALMAKSPVKMSLNNVVVIIEDLED